MLVLIGAIPLLILLIYSGLELRTRAAQDVRQGAMHLVEQTASKQQYLVETTRQSLSVLARVPQIRNGDSQPCNVFLAEHLAQASTYANFGVIDMNGDVLCSGKPFNKAINLRDRAYFQRTLKSHDFAIGDYQIGRITHIAVLVFSYPVLNENDQLQSVLFAALPLTWLKQQLGESGLPGGSVINVIDHASHKLLARYPESDIAIGTQVANSALVQTIHAAGGSGTAELADLDGVSQLVAFAKLQDLPDGKEIYISLGIPLETAYREPTRIFVRNLMIFVLVILLMLLLAWRGSDALILKQVNSLLTTTRRLAAGQLGERVKVTGGKNEITALGREFNLMAVSLEQRDSEAMRAEYLQRHQLAQERLVTRIQSRFLDRNKQDMPGIIEEALQQIGEFSNVDRCVVFLFSPADTHIDRIYEWHRDTVRPLKQGLTGYPMENFGWLKSRLQQNGVLVVPNVDALPAEAHTEQAGMRAFGVQSVVATPLSKSGKMIGFLALDTVHSLRNWTDADIEILKMVANVFVSAITQQHSDMLLRDSEKRLRHVINTVPGIIYTATVPDLSSIFVSPALTNILGYTPEEFIDRPELWLNSVHDSDRERVVEEVQNALDSGDRDFVIEYRIWHKDGETLRWVEDRGHISHDVDDQPTVINGLMTDVTEHKLAENKIARIDRAHMTISACNEALVRASDETQLLQDVCRIVVELGGYRMAWVGYAGHDEDKTIRPVAWAGHEDGFLDSVAFSWADPDWGSSTVGVAIWSGEVKHVADITDDSEYETCRVEAAKRGYASIIALPLIENNTPFGVLAIYSSEKNTFNSEEVRLLQELSGDLAYGVTTLRMREKQVKAEKEIAYLAFHDSLTGLPNRAMLMQSLDYVLAQAERDNRSIAILFIDLDQFKLVNDSLGHETGDALLCEVAKRLSSILRKTDIVARQGGDEFIVMMTDSSNRHANQPQFSDEHEFGLEAGVVAEKIITAISQPHLINGNEAYVGASIGISLFPADARDADTLLQHADSAMYRAKELGRGEYHFYSHDLSERQQQRLSLQTRLHKAIEKQEFELRYQPIVDLQNGEIVGSEALIRWQPHDGVMIMPDEFLSVAEDSGMIVSIGHWVAEQASRQLRAWQERGWQHYVAINLSVRQFWERDFVKRFMDMITAAGIAPEVLKLEVTESAMAIDPQRMESILREFDAHGFHMSLDDFGTGYSSLSRLAQLPLHTLKIDKSFTDGIPHNTAAMAIVTTIIELSENMGIHCIAEGIETTEQWTYLRNLGCRYGQGYFFSKPVPVTDLEEMFQSKTHWTLNK
jgi:diguanylate cyclase (GGDEF)-like protein/PAS domain S-box-containing protein